MEERVDFILVRPQHPGNVGGAARALKTMGFTRLVLVAPQCDPLDAEAVARASGAADLLQRATVVASLVDALRSVTLAAAFTARSREFANTFLTPERFVAEAKSHLSAMPEARVALVFGNEAHGLNNDEVWRCSFPVAIPTSPSYGSLNLASAVQVAAYLLARACSPDGEALLPHAAVPQPDAVPCTLAEIDGVVAHFLAVAAEVGFYDPQEPKRLEARLRRWLLRSRLERAEANILRGFLKRCGEMAKRRKSV